MGRKAKAAIAAALTCLVLGCAATAEPESRLLIRAHPGVSLERLDALLAPMEARRVGLIESLAVHIVALPAGINAEEAARALARHPDIQFAEVDARVPAPLREKAP